MKTIENKRMKEGCHPLISCPKVNGVASCKCVRPIFIICSNAVTFSAKVSFNFVIAGNT